jgi:hypothetical protein
VASPSAEAVMNSPIYRIEFQVALGEDWIEWFATLTLMPGSHGGTILLGPLTDQTALYGMLAKVRNLTLVAVTRIDSRQAPGWGSDATLA